ncbi:NUDIX domain-containing protein [Acaryochloris marina NIES-2412]|uniref:NUDIX domain-containing protein n=1 Tax=Acaryochloris marina TaxID=155978 RepID=UPI0040598153
MKFNNRPNRCIEVSGKTCWISRDVTVLGVIFFVIGETAYIPLGLRGDQMPTEPGKWGLPGGYLDYDETAGEAIVREIWEELGLNIPHLQSQYPFQGALDQPYYVGSRPLRLQNVSLRFPLMFFLENMTQLPPLQPQVAVDEVAETRWYELGEAINMQLAFNHNGIMKHCLESYYKDIWSPALPTS